MCSGLTSSQPSTEIITENFENHLAAIIKQHEENTFEDDEFYDCQFYDLHHLETEASKYQTFDLEEESANIDLSIEMDNE